MSLRIRGLEINISVRIDGQPGKGTWLKAKSFTLTERSEIVESEYLGENKSDLDKRIDGYDVAIELDMQDSATLDFMAADNARQKDVQRPQNVSITAFLAFRERGVRNKAVIVRDGFLRFSDVGFGGRKEYVSTKAEGKFKEIELIAA